MGLGIKLQILLEICKKYSNKGKGDAVRAGMDAGENDILMILDADMAVDPKELPKFIGPFEKGKTRFVNGNRLT